MDLDTVEGEILVESVLELHEWELADVPAIAWSISAGSITYTRTPSGATNTWTGPMTEIEVTISARPDDSSTSSPGNLPDLINDTGSRDDGPGLAVTLQVQGGKTRWKFRPGPAMAKIEVVQNSGAGTAADGLSPRDGAKVWAGQEITLNFGFDDQDEQSQNNGANWAPFNGIGDTKFEDKYEIKIDVENARLNAIDGPDDHTYEAVEDGAGKLTNIPIFIDTDLDPNDQVTVTIRVKDKKTVKNNIPVEGIVFPRSAARDDDLVVVLHWTVGAVFPTTAAGVTQFDPNNGQTVFGTEQATHKLVTFFRAGADLNGGGNNAPNYAGVAVNERFGTFNQGQLVTTYTTNAAFAWFTTSIQNNNPNKTPTEIVNTWVKANVPHAMATFMINNADEFSDTYQGERAKKLVEGIPFTLSGGIINAIPQNPGFVEVGLQQHYDSGPNQDIRVQTIRSRRYLNGTSTLQVTQP